MRAERATRAQEYFAANAADWDDLRARHIREDLVEAEMTNLLSDTKCDLLVDLGTGTGRMLEIFSSHASRAVGFDINANMLTIARARLDNPDRLHCQVRQGDCADVPWKTEPPGWLLSIRFCIFSMTRRVPWARRRVCWRVGPRVNCRFFAA